MIMFGIVSSTKQSECKHDAGALLLLSLPAPTFKSPGAQNRDWGWKFSTVNLRSVRGEACWLMLLSVQ